MTNEELAQMVTELACQITTQAIELNKLYLLIESLESKVNRLEQKDYSNGNSEIAFSKKDVVIKSPNIEIEGAV